MKSPKQWMVQLGEKTKLNKAISQPAMLITESEIAEIQSDAMQADGPSDAELLYHYHSQQKEWWRTNTNDPHNIGTAMYAMHCELVDIYDAITSGDARRNYEANAKIEPSLANTTH